MDCSDFRRHHLAYVDDTLPGDVLVAAERHRVECAACGAHDTLVRRSLLLARNLSAIEPSANFATRLEARLREVRAEEGGVRAAGWDTHGAYGRDYGRDYDARWYGRLVPDVGGWGRQAAAAAVVLAAVSAGYALRGGQEGASNVAVPAATAAAFSTPAFGAASLGTGEGAPELAALPVGVAPRGRRAPSAARGDTHRRATRAPASDVPPDGAPDADGLGMPAYIPLPAGGLEAAALLGPASAGIPVWPAALLAGEAPGQLRRAAPGAPSVRLVGLSH